MFDIKQLQYNKEILDCFCIMPLIDETNKRYSPEFGIPTMLLLYIESSFSAEYPFHYE